MNFVKQLQAKPDFYSKSGVPKEAIEQAEKALQLRFSPEYHDYLVSFGVATANGHEFTGLCPFPRLNVVDVTLSERQLNEFIPLDLYVVEQTHLDDIVVWQSSTGEVYGSAPDASPVKIAQSLKEYLET